MHSKVGAYSSIVGLSIIVSKNEGGPVTAMLHVHPVNLMTRAEQEEFAALIVKKLNRKD